MVGLQISLDTGLRSLALRLRGPMRGVERCQNTGARSAHCRRSLGIPEGRSAAGAGVADNFSARPPGMQGDAYARRQAVVVDKDTRQLPFDVYTGRWLAFSSLSVPGPVRSLHPSGLALAISTFPIQLATWQLLGFFCARAFACVRTGGVQRRSCSPRGVSLKRRGSSGGQFK